MGSAIRRATAASIASLLRSWRLNRPLARASAFLICASSRSCRLACMPQTTHQAAMSPPMVPAPMTCTLRGLKPSLGASSFSISDSLNTRRRLREVSLAISGANISVSAMRMRDGIVAVLLEQIDQAERRRVMLLAHLLGRLGAHLLGEQPRTGCFSISCFHHGAPLERRFCSTALRAAQRRLWWVGTS